MDSTTKSGPARCIIRADGPILETERLILRNYVPADWASVDDFLSDPLVTRYMHFSSWTPAQRRQWFSWCIRDSRRADRDADNWAISLKETGVVIGWLGIGAPSHPTTEHERDFGYALSRTYWGHGYMTEALSAVLVYEFEVRGSQRVFAECEAPNIASARVMEKAGMRYEGTFHDSDGEGNLATRRRYGIHRQEYSARMRTEAG